MSKKAELLAKLKKNSTIAETDILGDSSIFNERDTVPTDVRAINVALSANIDRGLTSGILTIAGPSRHFKTAFALLIAGAFLKKYPEDGVILFYDSEFGSPQSYFDKFNVDSGSVIHTPIVNIEQLKHDISVQLDQLGRTDRVLILIDSVGNLASKKEVEDALKSDAPPADMTRAKQLKSLFRIVTPHLVLKQIPLININHVYQDIGMFPKTNLGGGQGPMLASDNVWFVGRQAEREGTELVGYNFVINIEKSRYVREKSKIPINVTFDGGINRNSGLFDMAVDAGVIISPKKGWYKLASDSAFGDKGFRRSDVEDDDEFWDRVVVLPEFLQHIESEYRLN